MPGPLSIGQMARGLRRAIIDPIVSDFRQGNRVLQQEYPLAYQAAQLHPAVGIPTSAMNYADAMSAGDTEGAIKASLSGIPIAERTYRVGSTLATGLGQVVGGGTLRRKVTNVGVRTAAGEQTAESLEAGYAQGLRNTF